MPNTLSAKKRLRQSFERKAHNKSVKSALKTQVKKVVAAVAEGNIEEAESQYRVAAKHLDRAAARNIIHKNAASRKKSRLQSAIKTAKGK